MYSENVTYKYHVDGTLPENGEVFVFGSNLAGRHGAGAAKIAVEKFGAKYGFAVGFPPDNRSSFAIPTKDMSIKTLPLNIIRIYINAFIFTTQRKDLTEQFFVTRVGCELAGYADKEIVPLFKGAINCSFANEWKPYLEE